MSVLIKGMSGYECCADCEFCGGLIMPDDIYTCDCPSTRGMNITRAIEEDCRHPDCPLVELPEKHGRLFDSDEVKKVLDDLPDSEDKWSAIALLEWAIDKRWCIEAEGEEWK